MQRLNITENYGTESIAADHYADRYKLYYIGNHLLARIYLLYRERLKTKKCVKTSCAAPKRFLSRIYFGVFGQWSPCCTKAEEQTRPWEIN